MIEKPWCANNAVLVFDERLLCIYNAITSGMVLRKEHKYQADISLRKKGVLFQVRETYGKRKLLSSNISRL